ncbi:putative N-acetylmannosaminyltransferase [Hartmannibacter diazotrophicus]|uniref:Putative N-acetylmannosaminyltransferase n=2 Tax=Hartmannibacter diazotrophicus TaxID=1482074 RepID=A0A2C9D3Q2_9HYPH|nr:putative N-acetylmannosaminyltransferase [Hartmannibacter diazotrophicus]
MSAAMSLEFAITHETGIGQAAITGPLAGVWPKDIPTATLGGMEIAVIDRALSAEYMANWAVARRNSGKPPFYITSANGQVISLCATNREVKALFDDADLIHADGSPMVAVSQFACAHPVPERAATTDLFHDVAEVAQRVGASFFLLGAREEIIRAAEANVRKLYPHLKLVGARNGYFKREEESAVIAEINDAAPDILWVGLGVPLEQAFISRNLMALDRVGLVKTTGGLFDFLSNTKSRAPEWMQRMGLEWLYRASLEPTRLGWRYLTTNPHAMWLLLTKSK